MLDVEGDASAPWHAAPEPVHLAEGEHELVVRYESVGGPARIQLGWEGESFRREPFPPWGVEHRVADRPAGFERQRIVDEGHLLALEHGCLRCHLPAGRRIEAPRPGPRLDGPRLDGIASRIRPGWLVHWLAEPRAIRPGARMPQLFARGAEGDVERWLVAQHLLHGGKPPPIEAPSGRWRRGKKEFVQRGCVACHLLPDTAGQEARPGRRSLRHLAGRAGLDEVVSVILEPHRKYPEGTMPRFGLSRDVAREIARYIRRWGAAQRDDAKAPRRPGRDAVLTALRRLRVPGADALRPDGEVPAALVREGGRRLVERRRCGACHEGVVEPLPPLTLDPSQLDEGCLDGGTSPRFSLSEEERGKLRIFLASAAEVWVDSEFHRGRTALERSGCFRCHARRPDAPSQLEEIVRRVDFEMFPARLPYLRVPALPGAGSRFRRAYLAEALERGIHGVRPRWYTYGMPGYGAAGSELARALIAAAGESPGGEPAEEAGPPTETAPDTAKLVEVGAELVGHGAYSCVSCHTWKGRSDFQTEPGSAAPDLTLISQRVRRDWFDRWLESPQRFAPRTPMPSFFPRGEAKAALGHLGAHPERQKEAIWRYLAQGTSAQPPRLGVPAALGPPAAGSRPRLGQIPLRLPGGEKLEALTIQFHGEPGDVVVYDVEKLRLHSWWEGARLLRDDPGWRTWALEGRRVVARFETAAPRGLPLAEPLEERTNAGVLRSPHRFLGFDYLPGGARVRTRLKLGEGPVVLVGEELRIEGRGAGRSLVRQVTWRREGEDAARARRRDLRYPRDRRPAGEERR